MEQKGENFIIISKKEAVERFGSDAQKAHFEKYGRFKSKDVENAFLRTLEQHFEVVEIIKDTKPYVYRLEGLRKQPVEREDDRKNNGKKLEYQYELNTLVLDFLRTECTDQYFTYNSLSQWLIKIGLVNDDVINTQYNRIKQKEHLERLKAKYSDLFVHPVVVKNFTRIIMKRLKQNLASTFTNLAKLGLIEHKKENICCLLDDTYRPLTSEENYEIKKMKTELRIKYGIQGKDLYKDDLSIQVERYYEEFYVELEERFGMKYTYYSHSIRWVHGAVATRIFINQLIEQNRLECQYGRFLLDDIRKDQIMFDLLEKFSIKSILLAQKREKRVNDSDHNYILFLKYCQFYTKLWKQMLEYFDLSYLSYELEDEWEIG